MLDLNNPLTQVLADGAVTYLYGLDRIAQEEAAIEYYLPDGLGSARQLSDDAGALTRAASFEPFGVLLEATGPSASPYGFTCEWHDPPGLINLPARTYSPELGIFLSRDPRPPSGSPHPSLRSGWGERGRTFGAQRGGG